MHSLPIEFLKEKMEISLQDLSSYDEYVTEVRSGRLEWSPGTVDQQKNNTFFTQCHFKIRSKLSA